MRFVAARDGSVWTQAAGLNAPVAAYLAEGYASPTQECFLVPNIIPPWTPPVIPVCHVRSRNASNYLDLNLVYDVFPSTLSAFYSLTPHYVGYGLAWGQAGKVKFRTLQDADGDGLDITVDPNDSLFDTDGDTVTDLKEVQIGTDPTRADTDSDGLNDREELRFGSNPLTNDTDGDGLTDDLERVGWSIGYNYINGVAGVSWTYPVPKLADADDDCHVWQPDADTAAVRNHGRLHHDHPRGQCGRAVQRVFHGPEPYQGGERQRFQLAGQRHDDLAHRRHCRE